MQRIKKEITESKFGTNKARLKRQIVTQKTFDDFQKIDDNSTQQILKERDAKLRKKVVDKLGLKDFNQLQFDYADQSVPFSDLYILKHFLGVGGFGAVVAAQEKESKKNLALKIVVKDQDNISNVNHVKMLKREAEVLKDLDHENIIKIYQLLTFQNYVVMEIKLTKESLKEFNERRRDSGKPLTEEECALIMKGILSGLQYLHDEKNIIHRDFKTSNVLIGSYNHLSKVKIIDFGLAVKNINENLNDFERCGTFIYQPPEQAQNTYNYGKKADIWAAGIVMFELLTGRHPFEMENLPIDQFLTWIKNVQSFKFPEGVSPLAKDLISKLCCPKQYLRLKARQALQHPWITRKLDGPMPQNEYEMTQNIFLKSMLSDAIKSMYFLSLCEVHNQQTVNRGDVRRILSTSYEHEIKKQSGMITEDEEDKLTDHESIRETTAQTKQTTQQDEEISSKLNVTEKSFKIRTLRKSQRLPYCTSHDGIEEQKIPKDFPQQISYNASVLEESRHKGQKIKFKKKLVIDKGHKKPAKKISRDKIKNTLEIPDTSRMFGATHRRKGSAQSSYLSINSPQEVRVVDENFSDIDLSIEDKQEQSNPNHGTQKIISQKYKNQKTNKSHNAKLPEIEKNSTIMSNNSSRHYQNDFLTKLREQREIRAGSQISHRIQVISKKSSLKSFLNENLKQTQDGSAIRSLPKENLNGHHEMKRDRKKEQQDKTFRKVGSTAHLVLLINKKNANTNRKQNTETPQLNLKTNLLTFEFAQQIKSLTPIKPVNIWNKQ